MYTMKDQKLIDAICELYKDGATIKEVAAAAGISATTVHSILKERGLTRPRGVRSSNGVSTFNRTCPSCGNTKHLCGAVFCMTCGTLLATKAEMAEQAAHNLRKYLEPYKSTQGMDHVLRDCETIIDYFKSLQKGA